MFIYPKWSAPSRVRAASTTRHGGVSQGVFASLNLGGHVGDLNNAVTSNRVLISEALALPQEPCWLQQVHGVDLVDAALVRGAKAQADGSFSTEADGSFSTEADGSFLEADGSLIAADGSLIAADGSLIAADGSLIKADGSYTTKADVVCAVMTADCLPLLLSNKAGSQIAAVHAGWRGMASGIIERAVAAFDCPPAELVAWAGPSIGPNKFEIGGEVRTQLGGSDHAYRELPNGKLLANLYQLAGERLLALGVGEYSYENVCTYSDAERFFSYRRDGQCGRMASLIWLTES